MGACLCLGGKEGISRTMENQGNAPQQIAILDKINGLNIKNIRQGVRSRSCLSAERRHFSSPRKKHFYFTKSFPNGIIGCVERGFYKKITRSPVSGDQVIRCCSDLMFPPKRDFILKKSLFLDGVHVQMINLFIKKFTHRLSALPQPYCSLSESPLSSLLSTCQPCSCPAA